MAREAVKYYFYSSE